MTIPAAPALAIGSTSCVHVEHCNFGVINTGTIQSIESAVGLLKQHGNDGIAESLSAITEAVRDTVALDGEVKNQAAELISSVADEAAKPESRRRLRLVRSHLVELAGLLSGVDALSSIWQTHGDVISRFFGL